MKSCTVSCMEDPNGQVIKSTREARGLSRIELAARVGCSYSHLYNLETGRKRAKPELLARIARELGKSVDDLRVMKEAA